MDANSIYLANKLTEAIQQKQTALMDTLISGRATDYAHYRHIAGQLGSYTQILNWIEEFIREAT